MGMQLPNNLRVNNVINQIIMVFKRIKVNLISLVVHQISWIIHIWIINNKARVNWRISWIALKKYNLNIQGDLMMIKRGSIS